MRVERRTQLSVYLENRVGALAALCDLIARRAINLLAICAIDTVEEAVLRMVPADADAARRALEDHGFRAIETPVLAVELANAPGATGQLAASLAEAGINIDYLYASAHPEEGRALLVVRTHQIDLAERVLSKE
jgi:hypothetical protein